MQAVFSCSISQTATNFQSQPGHVTITKLPESIIYQTKSKCNFFKKTKNHFKTTVVKISDKMARMGVLVFFFDFIDFWIIFSYDAKGRGWVGF